MTLDCTDTGVRGSDHDFSSMACYPLVSKTCRAFNNDSVCAKYQNKNRYNADEEQLLHIKSVKTFYPSASGYTAL